MTGRPPDGTQARSVSTAEGHAACHAVCLPLVPGPPGGHRPPLSRLPATLATPAMPRIGAFALAFAILLPSGGTGMAQPAPGDDAGDLSGEPGSELRVWLVTAAPGDAVWERFGHNAIRILDTVTGRDVSYNWGIFDFNQPGFVPRFLKGEMLYMMAGYWTDPMVASYTDVGRDVVLQELALTPSQRAELQAFLEWNALPENRDYRYDYFRDNCSTRVRDALDRVLGGALSSRFAAEPTGTSYRWHVRRLTRTDPLLYTGMDVLLGAPGDRPISVWEEMFLPMTLRDAVRRVTVPGVDGAPRPLVMDETRVGPGTRAPDPPAPPRWLPWYLLLGGVLGGLLAWSGRRAVAPAGPAAAGGERWARVVFTSVAVAWSLLAGLVGTLLVLVLFTDHVFMAWNANLLLASPLSLAVAILVPRALRRAHGHGSGVRARWALRAAGATTVLALAGAALAVATGVLPGTGQGNAIFLALAIPVHAGLWWGLRDACRVGRPTASGGP